MKESNHRFTNRKGLKGIGVSRRFVRRSNRNHSPAPIVPADADHCSVAEWQVAIEKASAKGVHDTLRLARLVSRAHDRLSYGQWELLWRSGKPFSKGKANMLRAIGETFGDGQNSNHLPTHWNTLYYLARMGRPLVERLIAEGRVHPGLLLREAKELLAEFSPDTRRKSSRSGFSKYLAPLVSFVRANIAQWTPPEREFAQTRVLRLAAEITNSPVTRPGKKISQLRTAKIKTQRN